MKAMVGVVLAILIIFGLRLFWPSSDIEMTGNHKASVVEDSLNQEIETPGETLNGKDASLPVLNGPSDEEKTRLMRAEYEILEESRKELKRHISRMKHDMWGLKFPAEIAKNISNTVLGASKLLKNPHMLGAFSNAEQIKDETAKINFAEKSLDEIDEIIKAKVVENANAVDAG